MRPWLSAIGRRRRQGVNTTGAGQGDGGLQDHGRQTLRRGRALGLRSETTAPAVSGVGAAVGVPASTGVGAVGLTGAGVGLPVVIGAGVGLPVAIGAGVGAATAVGVGVGCGVTTGPPPVGVGEMTGPPPVGTGLGSGAGTGFGVRPGPAPATGALVGTGAATGLVVTGVTGLVVTGVAMPAVGAAVRGAGAVETQLPPGPTLLPAVHSAHTWALLHRRQCTFPALQLRAARHRLVNDCSQPSDASMTTFD